jgi:predicted enzyme related to lactoylglutathione lyase
VRRSSESSILGGLEAIMKHPFPTLLFILIFAAPLFPQNSASTDKNTPAPVVFFDIAGPESAKLNAFYGTVFGWKTDSLGRVNNIGLDGALRQDPTDKVIYIGVPDVTAALKQVEVAGGKIITPRFEVKGVVILGLFKDPAGNTMGLVEMKDGKPKIP